MKKYTQGFTAVLVAASFLFFAFVSAPTGYDIGDQAIDFNLKNIDGSFVSLSNYPEAKGFIVIFTCNHCPFAKMYEDRIIALNAQYTPQGYPVIAINPNDPAVSPADSYEAMQERAEEKNFVFPYLFDEGQHVYPLFGATRTPHTFLLDADRIVRYIGAIDDNHKDEIQVEQKYLEEAITAIENGLAPDPATTKAIGCSIKSQ